jgi:hypothetical protein
VVVPFPELNRAVEGDDAAKQREEKRERAVGHLGDAVVGDVADPQAALAGGRDVDVVVADAARGDNPQSGEPSHVRPAERAPYHQPDDIVTSPRPRRRLNGGSGRGQQRAHHVQGVGRRLNQDAKRGHD